MTIDRYTKFVLTIIALSLALIAIQLSSREAKAQTYSQNGIQMVAICNMHRDAYGKYWCADVVDEGRLRIANK